jgi:Spy/CpxP family protein refolding chaperone
MRRSKVILTTLIALLAVGLVVTPALARRGGARGARSGMGFVPQFTSEQQEQIEQIHEKYNDERAELTNRAKVLAIELEDLVGDGEPNFNGIEAKLEEISKVRLDLMKLRLRIHKEIRPLLDDDQRTLFDAGLARIVGRGGAGWHRGMTGRGAAGRGMRPMAGRRSVMGRGSMHCPFGMGWGMMRGDPPADVEDDD